MSALGQKQTCAAQKVMSALPPKADIGFSVGNLNNDVGSSRARTSSPVEEGAASAIAIIILLEKR
ncbi:MAG: hypothetical protein WA645_12550, partial [Pseudolabrys sp.]